MALEVLGMRLFPRRMVFSQEFTFADFDRIDEKDFLLERLKAHIGDQNRAASDNPRKDRDEAVLLGDLVKAIKTAVLGGDAAEYRTVSAQVFGAYDTLKARVGDLENSGTNLAEHGAALERESSQIRAQIMEPGISEDMTATDIAELAGAVITVPTRRATTAEAEAESAGGTERISDLEAALTAICSEAARGRSMLYFRLFRLSHRGRWVDC
jgi:hypothetical protein